jgi:hypothetical protein
MTETKIETLKDVKARQTMWLPWMEQSTQGLTQDDLVETTSKRYPFGTYLITIAAAK